MKNSDERHQNTRHKNWVLLGLLIGLCILLFAISFVKFGETVTSVSGTS